MKIMEIDDLISQCTEILDNTNGRGNIIESYLNQFLVVKMYRAFEEQIRDIIVKRAEKSGDSEIISYVRTNHKKFQGILTSDIQKQILRKFSLSYSEEFQEKVTKDNIGQSFNSIISNRHNIVHSGGPVYATFNDTINAYNKGHEVLDVLIEVFGLKGSSQSRSN